MFESVQIQKYIHKKAGPFWPGICYVKMCTKVIYKSGVALQIYLSACPKYNVPYLLRHADDQGSEMEMNKGFIFETTKDSRRW